MKSAFSTLSRIQKFNIDEKRKVLAEFLRTEEEIENRLKKLNQDFEREKKYSQENENQDFGKYLRRYLETREAVEMELLQIREKIEKIKDEIADLFKEQKTFDIVDDNRKKAKQKENDDKEQKSIDEIGTNKYIKDNKK